jgi:signal transduction histidine kinase
MAASRLRRLRGIRVRTAGAACIVLAVALIVAGTILVVVMRRHLVEGVEDATRTREDDVAALLRHERVPANLKLPSNDDSIVQVVAADGRVLVSSSGLEGSRPFAAFRPFGSRVEVRRVKVPDARGGTTTYLVVAQSQDSARGRVTIYVGGDLEQVEESVAFVRRLLILLFPILLALVAGTCWYVVGRALRPVDAMRRELEDITAHSLDRRVPQPDTDDEIGRLARTMNETLDRLEAFTERQRRFVADASHELQSPLTSSLAGLEVALAEPDDRAWRRTAVDLVEENRRMTQLVADLLLLARFDEGTATPPRTLIDLDDLVRTEVGRLTSRTGITIDADAVRPVEIRGNPGELARLVRNLLENAERYATSRIEVATEAVAVDGTQFAEIVIADDGPGIPTAARARVFERFARVDDSRSRGTGGTGLGLAIVRQVAERHGGDVTLSDQGPGARFVVHLPIVATGA